MNRKRKRRAQPPQHPGESEPEASDLSMAETDAVLTTEADENVLRVALEREKMALERERVSYEREQLQLEREKWEADRRFYDRRRQLFVVPGVTVLLVLIFCLVGIGIGTFLRRPATIQLDTQKIDPMLIKTDDGTGEREAVAYLLLMK